RIEGKRSYFDIFFQAGDGIRYFHVTGVQTCALPISGSHRCHLRERSQRCNNQQGKGSRLEHEDSPGMIEEAWVYAKAASVSMRRSEERRVGKEGSSRRLS